MDDLAFASATELAGLVRRKEVSPVELVEGALRRIDKLDGQINAFVTVVEERALAEARIAEDAVTAGGELPPFHGVPIGIKDLARTEGIRTTFSSRAFADYVPDEDAAVVRRIKDAGFIVLGKTNAPEFGTLPFTESLLNGACRNPWDTTKTPGGSSGGAAAALAAGMIPVAHGGDGGGSIRIPASCCGLFGIKPSRGRVSYAPFLGEMWEGFDVIGPISRSVKDAAALLDIMEGYEIGDPYWIPSPESSFAEEAGKDPGRLRIGFTAATPNMTPIEPVVEEAMKDAARLLEELGHEIVEFDPGWVDPELSDSFIKIVQINPVYYGATDPELLDPVNAALLEAARGLSSIDYVQAKMKLEALTRRLAESWQTVDVLLTPTLAMAPVPVGWAFEEEDPWMQLIKAGMFIPFTPPANISGLPAVSVPLFWSDEGMPIGVQLIGRPADEATLIRVSAQLEEARPWTTRRPPLS